MKSKAFYSQSKMVDQRTINYRGSVKSKSDPFYQDLKKVIATHNAEQEEREQMGLEPHYLRVRGRGRGPHTKDGVTYRRSIPDALATHFDVYVVRDTDKMKAYNERKSKKNTSKIKTIVSKSMELLEKNGIV